MASQEHIHIISAGEKIHLAYPAAFRIHPTITRTCIFADSTIYDRSPDPETEKLRLAVRHSIDTVKEISSSLSIPCSRELVFSPVYPAVRDSLSRVHREFPGVRFTFDLSGGSKPLCMALFTIAAWLEGEVYSTFDEKTARPVPLPTRSVRSLLENPNYQTILAILLRTGTKNGEGEAPGWVSRQYIFNQLWPVYVPSRTKKAKPGDPSVQPVTYRRGRKPAADLTHGTFSGFMGTLRDAGLITDNTAPANRKERIYRITERGEIAFRFFSDPATSSLVRTLLEKT